MSLQTIQRTAVKSWLLAVRLPLSAAEVVVGKQGAQWPPALAFEGFEASVKRNLGHLLGDSQLVQEGTLGQGKVEQLLRATELEEAAERRRVEGEARLAERHETAEEANRLIERRQEEREAQVQQDQAQREQAVEVKARRKEEAARAADQSRQEAVAAQERQARATRLDSEANALRHEREAVEAKREVVEVDQALEATKAARKKRS